MIPLLELEILAPKIPAALERRRLGDTLGKTATKVSDAPRQAERLAALSRAASELGARTNATVAEALKRACEEADEIGVMMAGAKTTSDLEAIREDYAKLGNALTRLDNEVRAYWSRVVLPDFQGLGAIGDVLARIKHTAGVASELKSLAAEAGEIVTRTNAEQFATTVAKLKTQKAALESRLQRMTEHPEVDAFILAVPRGATLRDVTPAVLDWLDKYGARDAFLVRGAG